MSEQLCPVMVPVFQSIPGRLVSPPSQMIWSLNLVYRSFTDLHGPGYIQICCQLVCTDNLK